MRLSRRKGQLRRTSSVRAKSQRTTRISSSVREASAWQTIQRSHAIANGLFVAAVNRVGHEGPADGGIEFWGKSFVSDPFGIVLAEASGTEEELLVVQCDPRRTEEVRRNWPFLRDRRIDAYAPITRRMLDE